MGLVGLFDDWMELSAWKKLGLQFLASFAIAIPLAHWIGSLLPLSLPLPAVVLALVFWILLLTNSVNYLDNVNGLCAGTVFLLLAGLLLVEKGHSPDILIFMGAITGFLLLNFPKGRIFLGDSGSHLLGCLLSVYALMPLTALGAVLLPRDTWRVFLPVLLLGRSSPFSISARSLWDASCAVNPSGKAIPTTFSIS